MVIKNIKKSKKKTCFISATENADINNIEKVLLDKEINPVSIYNLLSAGEVLIDQVTKAISEANFIIGVFNSKNFEPDIFFQLGYAHALKKRIILIVPPSVNPLPSFFAGIT